MTAFKEQTPKPILLVSQEIWDMVIGTLTVLLFVIIVTPTQMQDQTGLKE
jgi:hypothetical protein